MKINKGKQENKMGIDNLEVETKEKNDKELNITREELALAITEYIEENNINIPALLILYPPYADEALISEDAIFAVNQMRNTGIMQGRHENYFEPQAKITIDELFEILRRLNEKIKND